MSELAATGSRPEQRGGGRDAPRPAARAGTERGRRGEAALVTRLRALHLEMVEAVVAGEGLERVAELAAGAAASPVAIVVPRLGVSVLAGDGASAAAPAALWQYTAARLRDQPVEVPANVVAEASVAAADELVGLVLALDGETPHDGDAGELLHVAALAALTELAVANAREEVEYNLRGSLLEELRARGEVDAEDLVRRAGRLGCDLRRGGAVLCARLTGDRPRHVVALICGEYQGALAEHLDDRVYALLPATGEDPAAATLEGARRLADRLRRHATVGVSSFYGEPSELPRALEEAELVLDVLSHTDAPIAEDIGKGTYRLLFRVLASHPEEVRSFYDDTVEPLVRYDDQYRTDLLGTLEAYLEHNCNMNATASAIFAHRHTVGYRLERVRDLTGLDPMSSEDRERLGLGLKAYRIIAPRLPR